MIEDYAGSDVPFLRLGPIREQLHIGPSEDALLARDAVVADLTRILEQLSRLAPIPMDRDECFTQQQLADRAGVHVRTVRRWRDRGLIFEWSRIEERWALLVTRDSAERFIAARPDAGSRGFRHASEVRQVSVQDPQNAQHIPRETLRRWRSGGRTRNRTREDKAAGLAWRWGIIPHRWNAHTNISDDTRRRRVQRDRLRRLQEANTLWPAQAAPRVAGAPDAIHNFVVKRWAAHQLIDGLSSRISYELITDAEDALRLAGWWFERCFGNDVQKNYALAALLESILAGDAIRYRGRLRIEEERIQHGVLRTWRLVDQFRPYLPGWGVRHDHLSPELSALAIRWLGSRDEPPVAWSSLHPARGRRGQSEDQRLILRASGPLRS